MHDTKLDIRCLVHDLTLLRIAIVASKYVDSRVIGCGLPKPSIGNNDCYGRVAVTLSFNLFRSYASNYLPFFSDSTLPSAETDLAFGNFSWTILEDTHISASFSSSQDTTLS